MNSKVFFIIAFISIVSVNALEINFFKKHSVCEMTENSKIRISNIKDSVKLIYGDSSLFYVEIIDSVKILSLEEYPGCCLDGIGCNETITQKKTKAFFMCGDYSKSYVLTDSTMKIIYYKPIFKDYLKELKDQSFFPIEDKYNCDDLLMNVEKTSN